MGCGCAGDVLDVMVGRSMWMFGRSSYSRSRILQICRNSCI